MSNASKKNTTLEKIEKLIVEGQHEVVEKLGNHIEKVRLELKQEIQDVKSELKQEIKEVKFQVKTLDISVRAAHYDIKELDKNMKSIDNKLDAHLLVPHAA